MADGIRFLIELDGKTQGAAQATQGLHAVEAAAKSTNEALHATGHASMEGTASEILKAEFWMEGLKFAAEKAAEGVKEVLHALERTVEVAAEEQRTSTVFGNLLGTEEGEKTVEYLERWSEQTEFLEDQTKNFGASLLRAKLHGEDFRNAMALAADSAALSTNKLEGAQSAIDAITRIKLTGMFGKRQAVGLGLDWEGMLGELSEISGKSVEAVEKGLTEGKIPFEQTFEAIMRSMEKLTGKHLGTVGHDMRKGLEAQISHVKELPSKYMEAMSKSPAMDQLSHVFDDVLAAFDPEKGEGRHIVSGMSDLLSEIAVEARKIDWKHMAATIGEGMQVLREYVAPIGELVRAVNKLADGFLDVIHKSQGLGDWLAELLHPELKQTHDIGKIQVGRRLEQAGIHVSHEPPALNKTVNLQSVPSDELGAMVERWQADEAKRKKQQEIEVPPNVVSATQLKLLQGGAAPNVHIGDAKADVVVNVNGGDAKPGDIHHAAKKGVEEGLTAAQEKQAAMAGVR